MNGLPYYKAYPRDFIEGTIGMRLELKGAYRILLDLIYLSRGKLPDEPRYIAANLGCSVRAWGNYRRELIEIGKIEVKDQLISNFRATLEVDKLEIISDNMAINARLPRKNKGLTAAEAKPGLSHSEPEPDIDKRDASASPKNPKRRCRLPEGWVPNERNVSDAKAKMFNATEIESEAHKFRDYHAAKGTVFADWDAGWRTWIANARKYAGGGMAGGAQPGRYGQGGSIASIVARRRAAGEV
jgi:hypothetical protein